MRKLAVALLILGFSFSISQNVYAFDRSYDAVGEDQHGTDMVGTVYSNNGEVLVYGSLTDQYGNIHLFEGRWNGFAHVSGIIENQVWVELDTD